MKKMAILVMGISLFCFGRAMAQASDTTDNEELLQAIKEKASIYTEYAKQKNYEDAITSWRFVFEHGPKYSVGTYRRGEEIITYMLEKTNEREYFDTLMMVFDQHIKHFGHHPQFSEGFALGRKGLAQAAYANGDVELLKQAFANLSRSFELEGNRVSPRVIDVGLQLACQLANNAELTRDEFLNLYMKYTEFSDSQIGVLKDEKAIDAFRICRGNLDAILFNSGLADCETLVGILTERYEANKESIDNLRTISAILVRRECTDSPLYTAITEEIYKLDPNGDAAFGLALMFLKREDVAKGEEYFKEAISKTESAETKESSYKYLSQIALGKKNYPLVKQYANEMLKVNPRSGAAYLMIGMAYGYGAEGFSNDPFERKSVYWAAVDKFNQAKRLDPSLADDANRYINAYTPHFPTHEEGFFLTISEGDEVKVKGWINETTKARYNK